MIKTRVTELLGIETPIIEGGMAIAGNGELAAAVSNGGGLGVVSSNPGWSKQSERTENVRQHLRRAKALTEKPLCANMSLQLIGKNPERHLDMLVEEGVKIVVTSGGSPGVLTQTAKDYGLTVMHVVANVRQARRSEDSGVDIVICEGYEAGGIEGADEVTSMVLIPSVVAAVSIPVVGAGGFGSGRGMVAALALGAEGIQMGSAFLATTVCHVHQNFKQAIVAADDTGTVMIQRMIGRLSRVIKTPRALQFRTWTSAARRWKCRNSWLPRRRMPIWMVRRPWTRNGMARWAAIWRMAKPPPGNPSPLSSRSRAPPTSSAISRRRPRSCLPR